MPGFDPKFTITARIASALMRIEAGRTAIDHLPINASVLASLRETARLYSTHYSTMIEGNRLTQDQVSKVVEEKQHFPGKERDEHEVLGYYAALAKVEKLVASKSPVTIKHVQMLHALVMGGGKTRVKPTGFRDGQNVIRDAATKKIVYIPPQAADVKILMGELIDWINGPAGRRLPCPITAGIVHYQFATVHPYYDGNGRTGRLLTTLVLHLGGYGLKGLYSLEEYYARKLSAYYEALAIGPSHNYYDGRAESDITSWIDYFCQGVAESFENVKKRRNGQPTMAAGDDSPLLRQLDPRQRKALELFRQKEAITSTEIARLFAIASRTARKLLGDWTNEGFLIVSSAARKNRKYGLARRFRSLVD